MRLLAKAALPGQGLGSLEASQWGQDRPMRAGRGAVLTDTSRENELTLAPSEPCSSKKLMAPLCMLLLGTYIKLRDL